MYAINMVILTLYYNFINFRTFVTFLTFVLNIVQILFEFEFIYIPYTPQDMGQVKCKYVISVQ
jgi:hypothetical protein